MKTTAATQQTGMKQQEFEKLFSEHGKMVYRAAYRVTGNKHEAQDVQQDVFLKLIDKGVTLEFTPECLEEMVQTLIQQGWVRDGEPLLKRTEP